MVEGVDLERLYGRNIIEGSNPSLSAPIKLRINKIRVRITFYLQTESFLMFIF